MERLSNCHTGTSSLGRHLYKYDIGDKPGDPLRKEDVCQIAFAHSYGLSLGELKRYQNLYRNGISESLAYTDRRNMEEELQNSERIFEIFQKHGLQSSQSAVRVTTY